MCWFHNHTGQPAITTQVKYYLYIFFVIFLIGTLFLAPLSTWNVTLLGSFPAIYSNSEWWGCCIRAALLSEKIMRSLQPVRLNSVTTCPFSTVQVVKLELGTLEKPARARKQIPPTPLQDFLPPKRKRTAWLHWLPYCPQLIHAVCVWAAECLHATIVETRAK